MDFDSGFAVATVLFKTVYNEIGPRVLHLAGQDDVALFSCFQKEKWHGFSCLKGAMKKKIRQRKSIRIKLLSAWEKFAAVPIKETQ